MKKTGKKKEQQPEVKKRKPTARKPSKKNHLEIPSVKVDSFPIVGMGASAGGLEALTAFFKNLPSDNHMAYILALHLDPGHSSMMPELLKRHTNMEVLEAQDGVVVEPDRVYVIPPNKDMSVIGRTLQINPPVEVQRVRMPIDLFFRSLAEDQGERAICIILSGTGSDGTLGMRAIHGAGGMCMVQDPESARYDGMPRSAVMTGLADYVLPVEKLPEQLISFVKLHYPKKPGRILYTGDTSLTAVQKILAILRVRTGHDFSHYKKTTILRRIERRMSIHQIVNSNAYVQYIQEHPEEIQILFRELLIRVTSFFRDPDAFSILQKKILPDLIAKKPDEYTVRVWVPGCGTGEEAYSIAILLRECMQEANMDFKVQIFGTDIDDDSIAQARAGFYPANISLDVSAPRLKRYFLKEETGYRIRNEIREWMVFAVQNVISDAPFTKLDLVSCRNLLIYLDSELQGKLIPMFHYSLRPGGFLFLGSSETVGGFGDLFVTLDRKWKIFKRREATSLYHAGGFMGFGAGGGGGTTRPAEEPVQEKQISFPEIAHRVLLENFAPPSVIVSERGDILFVHGQTGKFLEPAQGKPSMNVLDMAREGMKVQVRAALHRAAAKNDDVVMRSLQVRTNGGVQPADVTVKPIHSSTGDQRLFIVVFEEAEHAAKEPRKGKEPRKEKEPAGKGHNTRLRELERELYYTRENLQATIEELQASNEELKSTNEEFQSTNEEFQSTNEELETSKEELQSVNEELITVNTELQSKIEQLTTAENDMKNILDSINTGIIFLDEHLRIKRFNAEASKVINLIPTDVGRPLAHISANIRYESLTEDAEKVIDTLAFREVRVEAKDGRPYLMRITPYRTTGNVIAGVVITFTEMTAVAIDTEMPPKDKVT